jgi:hypothetical protein
MESTGYDEKKLLCQWNRGLDAAYSYTFILIALFSQTVVILFFYLKIFLYAHNSKKKAMGDKFELSHTIRIAKGLFGSYFLFMVCWYNKQIIFLQKLRKI